MTTQTEETSKKSTGKRINVTDEAAITLDDLYNKAIDNGEFKGNKKEYFDYLLKDYKNLKESKSVQQSNVKAEAEKPKLWFQNLSGKSKEERETKLSEIKKALGIKNDEDIIMTPSELFEKASEISGKSVDQIITDGAESEAQALITALRLGDEGTGKGRLGSADRALDTAFREIVEMIENGSYTPIGGVPITKISNRAGANFNSAKNWAKRRGYNFSETGMPIDLAIQLVAQISE